MGSSMASCSQRSRPLRRSRRCALVTALTAPLVATPACAAPLEAHDSAIGLGSAAAGTREYVLKPGETLWRVAHRYGVSTERLARENGITDPTHIRAGTILRVPEPAPTALAGEPRVSGTSRPSEPAARAGTDDMGSGLARERESPAASSDGKGSGRLRWPVEGKITARFGARDGMAHDGIDIAAAAGTPIHAAAAGKVVFAGRYGGYGNLVIVRHDDGLVTIYAHNSVNLVRRGQRVARGDIVGRVGTSRTNHEAQLHFEVREGVEARNPLKYLTP
jgi:murein DD-endopeptidase MepM/ murein hydrolase activator NlpD